MSWNFYKPTTNALCVVTLHVSVWVEIFVPMQGDICIFVTLHVSVWVEMKTLLIWASRFWSHAPRERVSWNCLSRQYIFYYIVTLHVSVWVEIHVYVTILWYFRSRSTWACELKFPVWPLLSEYSSHAPRERVSWNVCWPKNCLICTVTLHVSVWVEIVNKPQPYLQILSRSTWACELKCVWWFSDFWGR